MTPTPKRPEAVKHSPLPWKARHLCLGAFVIEGQDGDQIVPPTVEADARLIERRVNEGPAVDALVEAAKNLKEALGRHEYAEVPLSIGLAIHDIIAALSALTGEK